MKVLEWAARAARPDRPATGILHDEANARVVAFALQPGQSIPAHRSASTVLLHVVEGAGTFRGEGSEARLAAGETVVYAPGEEHAIAAGDGVLRFLAVIAPRP